MNRWKQVKNWLILIILLLGCIAFFYFDLATYFTFDSLKQHRQLLLAWTKTHYLLTVITFMLIYIIAVAISIPGATFLTLVGGFLFGIFWGTMYVVISATLGSFCIFLAVRMALESWIEKKAARWVNKMRRGFQENAVQYLLVLRFVPLFPFWVVNIVPALLGVRPAVFFVTTLIGIIPGSFIYVLLGSGLGHVFDQNQTPNLKIIFEPSILIPLIALGLLSILPTFYKYHKKIIKRN